MTKRFYAESDNDNRAIYVVDRYADPLGERGRTDIEWQWTAASTMRAARKLAAEFNADPPWDAWDTIQVGRDGYEP